jgi:hypothetical protein
MGLDVYLYHFDEGFLRYRAARDGMRRELDELLEEQAP